MRKKFVQTLLSYSLNELIGMADNIIAPLRLGVVKPTGAMTNANEDVLELIQKHLSMEQDLSALLKELAEGGNNMANLLSTVNGNSRIKKVSGVGLFVNYLILNLIKKLLCKLFFSKNKMICLILE